MRVRLYALWAVFVFSVALNAKPFKRVLVLSGGGLALPSYASIAQNMADHGFKPDLIISTCGSTVGATTYRSFTNAQQHHSFLLSKEFHGIMRSPDIVVGGALKLKNYLDPITDALNGLLFENIVMNVPQGISFQGALSHFPTSGTRLLMIAGRARFKENGSWSNLRHRYQETYFTDSKTASMLKGRMSDIHRAFPSSSVEPYVHVVSNVAPMKAARASISDPILMNPGRVNGDFYLTGGINLYPYELAQELGEEVFMTYPLRFEDYMDEIVEATYGFSAIARQEMAARRARTNWIDVFGKNSSFAPGVNLLLKLKEGVPRSHRRFQQIAHQEWLFGHERALEALRSKRSGSRTAHIRQLYHEQKAGKTEADFERTKLGTKKVYWKKKLNLP